MVKAFRRGWPRSIGLVLAVAVINFTLLQLAPGDAAIVIAGESGAGDPEIIAEIREELRPR